MKKLFILLSLVLSVGTTFAQKKAKQIKPMDEFVSDLMSKMTLD